MRKEFNEAWIAQMELIFGKEKVAELRKRQERRREIGQLIAVIIFSISSLALLIKLIIAPL
nr:MAG TPA: hypothetical protein [Caudoviricetes sp.]